MEKIITNIVEVASLLWHPGTVVELRALNTKMGTISGYYDDFDALARDAKKLSDNVNAIYGKVEAVYALLNPVNPDLLARSANRLTKFSKHTSSDADITRRRILLIDFDPVRPSGISSTDDEHNAALNKADEVYQYLWREHGWRGMILADSGNGAHILAPIDLPNDAESTMLCKNTLETLAFLFDDDAVHVDKTTYNAARICKLYGTMARKGDNRPERPHRLAHVTWIPKTPGKIVPREQLESVTALLPVVEAPARTVGTGGTFDLPAWIAQSGLTVVSEGEWSGGHKWILNPCPWNPSHTDRAAFIVQLSNGAISAKCHHNGCSEQNWHSLRDLVEPGWREHRDTDSDDEPISLSGWEEPKPLRSFVLPKFPVDALPDWGRNYVSALAEATQTPADLAGMMYLAVVSVSVQKKAKIVLKPKWVEPLNLYLVSFLASGERKTAVVSAMTSPISAYERRKEHSRNCDIADAKTEKKILEQQLKEVMGDDLTDPANEEKAKQIARQLETLKIPGSLRLLAEDCTPEMLVKLMEDNDGTISVLSAEGDFFDIICGRYTEGKANLGVYLKAHTGEELRVDRINRPSNYVPNPALTLGLAVQPDVLNSLFENPSTRGRGLMARFLFSMPESYIGYRNIEAPSIPDEIESRYLDNMAALLDMRPETTEDEQTEPYLLTLSDEASALFIEFQKHIEPMLREGAELRDIRDWASKFAGGVARIAALLHYAGLTDELPFCNTVVSARTFKAAITIGEYLVNHARAVLARSGCDGAASDAEQIVKWIRREGLSTFTRRDAHRALQSHFAKADHMEPALSLLVAYNYLREEDSHNNSKKRGPGRPNGVVYNVNPSLNDMTQMTKCTYAPINVTCVNELTEGNKAERQSWTPARVAPSSEGAAGNAR